MSGTLVPMSTGEPARTHQDLKILRTAGYRVPGNFRNWVPRKFQKMGIPGYRLPRKFQKMGTAGYPGPGKFEIWAPKTFFGYRWVLGTGQIFNDADPWV